MKVVREGEWDTWDQVSRKKGKGRREEHSGVERRDPGKRGGEEAGGELSSLC